MIVYIITGIGIVLVTALCVTITYRHCEKIKKESNYENEKLYEEYEQINKKRKNFLIVIIVISMILLLTRGSGITVERIGSENNISMFVVVEHAKTWDVVYHKDTKVMYVISKGPYNKGNFTVMLDSKGMPLLYENKD